MRLRRPVTVLLSLLVGGAHGLLYAQNSQVLSDGKSFAESLAPQSNGQIVNPAGVNPLTWTGARTLIPSSTPGAMGLFSAPVENSPLFGVLTAQGAVSALGSARILACRNYAPSGDPIADQECAAIKFMNKDCVQLNNSQQMVVGATGLPAPAGVDCTDTYGTGQSNFGFQNTLTASDPVFHLSHVAQKNAESATELTCESRPIVVKPAQYETNLCSKSVLTNVHICSQELTVVVTTSYAQAVISYVCDGGELRGEYCVSTTMTPATPSFACMVGSVLDGEMCVSQSTTPAIPDYVCEDGELVGQSCIVTTPAVGVPTCPPPHMSHTAPEIWTLTYDINNDAWCTHWSIDPDDPIGNVSFRAATSYQCSSGATLFGSTCSITTVAILNYRCDTGVLSGDICITETRTSPEPTYTCASGTLEGDQCVTTTTTRANTEYSCPSGAEPVGDQCPVHTTRESWTSNCGPYEQSAGEQLGDPE